MLMKASLYLTGARVAQPAMQCWSRSRTANSRLSARLYRSRLRKRSPLQDQSRSAWLYRSPSACSSPSAHRYRPRLRYRSLLPNPSRLARQYTLLLGSRSLLTLPMMSRSLKQPEIRSLLETG